MVKKPTCFINVFDKKDQVIFFYDPIDGYFEFSNFYPCIVNINACRWNTTEHYYQAQKFKYDTDKDKIRQAETPEKAFYLGRNLSGKRIENWHNIKITVMRKALYSKFTHNIDLKVLLLKTTNKIIKEKSVVDSFWGIGADGKGKNMMGVLLMELRDKLHTQ